MTLALDFRFVVLISLMSIFLSARQFLFNLKSNGWCMSWYVLDHNSSYPSYWKLLETTIPCAAILCIVVNLSSRTCTDDSIICKSNYNMHFISCDLQQCKYSSNMECIWLPLLAMICHALVVCSTYDTLQLWSDKSCVVSALLTYSAIVGFAGVVLFDSQGPNTNERQWHFLCVCALTLSVWLLHAQCLLQLSKVITCTDRPLQTDNAKIQQRPDQLSMQTRRNYTLVEVVYILALTSFGLAFAYGIPMAIQLEYSVLFCVLGLAIINAITFHTTHDYLFGIDNALHCQTAYTTQDDTNFKLAHSSTSADKRITDLAWLVFGCCVVSLLLMSVKINISHTDYLHPP